MSMVLIQLELITETLIYNWKGLMCITMKFQVCWISSGVQNDRAKYHKIKLLQD